MSLEQENAMEAALASLPQIKLNEIELGFYSIGRQNYIENMSERCNRAFSLDGAGVEFNFPELLLVKEIVVESAVEEDMEISFQVRLSGSEKWQDFPSAADEEEFGFAICKVNDFAAGFRIRSTKSVPLEFLNKQKVRGILVKMVTATELLEMPARTEEYEKLSAEIRGYFGEQKKLLAALKAQHDSAVEKFNQEKIAEREKSQALVREAKEKVVQLQADAKAAQDSLDKLHEEIETAEEAKEDLLEETDKLKSGNAKLEANKQSLIASCSDLENRNREKEAELVAKNHQAAELNLKLQALMNDNSFFSEDIKGFAEQSNAQNIRFLLLLVGVLALATWLVSITHGALVDLKAFYKANPNLGVGELMKLMWFDFVMVSVGYTFLYKFSRPFIEDIRNSFQERRDYSAMSMIAKDTSDALAFGTDMTIEEKNEIRKQMRMDMIREYRSKNLAPKKLELPKDVGVRGLLRTVTEIGTNKSLPAPQPNVQKEGNA